MSGNTNADATSASTSSFITSLIFNTAIAGGGFAAFVVLRGWIKAIYEPRTYIPPKKDQASVLGKNPYMALWKIVIASPEEILEKNGVDPYVFVRFLLMMSYAMIPIWLISWAILLPVDSVNSTVDEKSGLDMFTFGNVAKDKQNRYWAHLIMDYVFIAWILFLIWREMQNWLLVRQKFLISPEHSKLAQANTVLITGIPKEYLDEVKLEELFSYLPGGVKRIWLNRDLKEMPGLWSRRMDAAKKLESAQVNLIKVAHKTRLDREERIAKLTQKKKAIPDSLIGPINPDLNKVHSRSKSTADPELSSAERTAHDLSLADQLVPRIRRPVIRLKPSWAPFGLGFLGIGQKVDAIDWARKEIAECSQGLEKSRQQLMDDVASPGVSDDFYPPLNSAFIHFNQQIAAHMAVQALTSHQPYKMNNRYIEQAPGNVIWRNLSMNPYEQNVRQVISWALTIGLIIVWAFPSAFVGALSNVTTLTATYSWLSWIEGDTIGKKILQGVISGILPPILLAVLNLLLPIILRQLAAFEGIPSKTGVELSLMTRFFIHQVVNTFFIVTLASGLISSIGPLAENPASIATILASQLPTASTFFITLVLTQFTGTMGTLLQPITLLFYYIKLILLGGSPRSQYSSKYSLQTPSWGTTWPSVTVYSVIMISYCVISPIINGFGACFFLLSAVVYKYLFIWVYDQPAQSDTGGVFFPKAITHVFVGIYVQEVCLCALFFLARNDNLEVSALPQAILMIILIVLTAAFQYVILTSYGPLIDSLPLSLAHLSYGMEKITRQRSGESGDESNDAQPVNSSKERLTDEKVATEKKESNVKNISAATQRVLRDALRRDNVMEELELAHMRATTQEDAALASTTAPGPPAGPTTDDPSTLHTTANQSNPEDQSEEEEEVFFAVPGGPGLKKSLQDDGNDPNAFFHPATKDAQRIIWLPKDDLGLCQAEMEENLRMGVLSSDKFAILNHKGKSQIFGPPPDDL